MKTGSTLESLANKILTQAKSKKDYAMDTRNLTMAPDTNLVFTIGGQERQVKPTKLCMEQIGGRVGIPAKYLERMRTEAPTLLAQNVNHWFAANPEVRMLRTIQNGTQEARAFLSHKYRPFDNHDLINAVLPRMQQSGLHVISTELTEYRLYLQATTEKLQGKVVGDIVQAGVVIRNSEVGCGSVAVEPLLYTLRCTNGMILPTAMRRHHVGRAGEGDWENGDAYEVFSDETRKLDDKAFWAKVNDVVTASLNETNFRSNLKLLENAAKVDTGKPQKAIEILDARFGLKEEEQASVLTHLARGGDLSLYGLANAVTRTAQDCVNYDRAIELERMGGEVIELPQNLFNN